MFSTKKGFLLLIGFLTWLIGKVDAQNFNSSSIKLHQGYVIAHTTAEQDLVQSFPLLFEIKLGQTIQDATFKSLYKCSLKRGFLVNYTQFNSTILGNTMAVGFYLYPTFAISPKWEISITPAAGLGYGTKPYNRVSHNQNFTYSTYLNNYTTVGFEFTYKSFNKFHWSAGMQLNHFSNGGFNKPNIGLNWITGGLSLSYVLQTKTEPKWLPKDSSRTWKPFTEIAVYGSYPKLDTNTNLSFPIVGIAFQRGKRGLLHGWNWGAELTYDPMYAKRGEIKKGLDLPPVLFAVTGGHEFILGRFLVTNHIGIYLHPTHNLYKAPFYHRWGFVFPITQRISVGMNIKAHWETANFMDARLVYRIK
jgi:hypothetical protein